MSKQHSERFVTLVNDALTRVDESTPKEVREKQENDNDDFILPDDRETDDGRKPELQELNT